MEEDSGMTVDRHVPVYPIRTVVQLTGVPSSRIRLWEARDHLIAPTRVTLPFFATDHGQAPSSTSPQRVRGQPVRLQPTLCLHKPTSFRRPRSLWRRTTRRGLGEGGFSLLESMVVLTLLGIVLGMSVSGMRLALARERIDGWVRTMTYDIAAGRQAALTRRTTVTVTIAASSYTIGALSGGTLRQATLPADIALTTTCPVGACSFDRRGVPWAGGTISVTNTTSGRAYIIRIEAGTGRVSFSEP